MRRRIGIIGSLLLTLAIAAPVAAAAASYHFSERGTGAEAFFSTFPADGIPVANTVYRDTFVGASSTIVRSDGATFSGSGLFFDSFTYTFDDLGTWTPVSEAFGFADGASLQVDRKLLAGAIAGAGAAIICDIDPSWNYTCTDGTFSTTASLTGQGPLFRQHGTSSWGIAGGYQSTGHGTGSYRNASATGTLTVNGSAMDLGSNWGGDMFRFTNGWNDVQICHQTC